MILAFISLDGRSSSQLPLIPAGSHLPAPHPEPKKGIASARSLKCSDHVRAEQEHRLEGVLLQQGLQVLQEQPHCGEEPLGADLRHRERRECLVRETHRSRVRWDDVPWIPFCKKKKQRKVERSLMADPERGFGSARISKR